MKRYLILIPDEVIRYSKQPIVQLVTTALAEFNISFTHGINNMRGDYGVTIDQDISQAKIQILLGYFESISSEVPITITELKATEFNFVDYQGTHLDKQELEDAMYNVLAETEQNLELILSGKTTELKLDACNKIATNWFGMLNDWLTRKRNQYVKK